MHFLWHGGILCAYAHCELRSPNPLPLCSRAPTRQLTTTPRVVLIQFPPCPPCKQKKSLRLFFVYNEIEPYGSMKLLCNDICHSKWYYLKFCLKATKSFSSKTDDNLNKEVQNFNFASAIAQILNSLQNLLPIVYIFTNAKVKVQFYICNIITALAISTTVQAQMLWLVCNYNYERKRIISLLNVSNIIVSETNNIIKVIKIKNNTQIKILCVFCFILNY